MKRKAWIVFFFVIVFGLPVSWYLFLQLFGENQFDLPKLKTWDVSCDSLAGASVVVDDSFKSEWPNEFARIRQVVEEQPELALKLTDASSCTGGIFSFYLIDADGWVRGQFTGSREEVDRLLAELDIYLMNERNESTHKRR